MDRAGVQLQVLSACPQLPYGEDDEEGGQGGQVRQRPVRRRWSSVTGTASRAFAALPMPHLDKSVREMGRALDDLGMAGIAMNTTVLGHALVDPDYRADLRRARQQERGAVPAPGRGTAPGRSLIANYHLTWMVGAPVEDTISIMQLITHGIPARYPDIKIINSHLGGALPMLLAARR